MSNICWIGIKETRKGVETAKYRYCHWGGDVDQNGEILLNHYTNVDLIRALLAQGDSSYIDADITKCCFYARDRGEEITPYIRDLNSNFRPNQASNGELCFLWHKNRWWVSYNQDGRWYELDHAVRNHQHTIQSREGM